MPVAATPRATAANASVPDADDLALTDLDLKIMEAVERAYQQFRSDLKGTRDDLAKAKSELDAAITARDKLAGFLKKTERAHQRAKHKSDFENIAQWLKWGLENSEGWETSGDFNRINFRQDAPEDEPSESEEEEDEGADEDSRERAFCKYVDDEAGSADDDEEEEEGE